MQQTTFVCALLAVVALIGGCGGGNGGSPTAVVSAAQFPPPPAIGAKQIDRMGRPAITSALVSPLADTATRTAARDAYNRAPRADWGNFSADIRASLGVYDALDGVCGNQVLADADATDATRYQGLTDALIDDRLYVNGASGLCRQYLGVELDATGLVPNSDCGGRTPPYDVIDVTYTAVSNDLSVAVSDGVASDAAVQGDRIFPFLAPFTPVPNVPAIAARQIDRMGRPAITSALISPLADTATRNAARDAYNAAPRADWSNFATDIRASLAVFDALDANCGNQILANPAAPDATRYDTLTGALIDDRLYVNAASATCSQYLGVELNATMLVANADCGGRTPLYDVIDVTYTGVSNDLTVAVGDGVPSDNIVHSQVAFPFLANPQP